MMRSIRLSLVIYFLALLAGALGAVSWFVYGTVARTLSDREQSTSRTLRDKEQSTVQTLSDREQSTVKEIEIQHEAERKKKEDDLDRHLLRQAGSLASKAVITSRHLEGYYPFGVLGASLLDQGHLFVWLWLAEGADSRLVNLIDKGSLHVYIESPEEVFTSATQAHEFFQITSPHEIQRSESLGDHQLELTEEERKQLQYNEPKFEDVLLTPEFKVRRVTLKDQPTKFHFPGSAINWGSTKAFDKKKYDKKDYDKKDYDKKDYDKKDYDKREYDKKKWEFFPKSVKAPRPFGPIRPGKSNKPQPTPAKNPYEGVGKPDINFPAIYIQYASDTSVLQDQILNLEEIRDQEITDFKEQTQKDLANLREQTRKDLTDLREQTPEELAGLRLRLIWISLTTFAGILIGSLLLIHRGMSPLDRLSEAVSKVSARDFQLKVDVDQLPKELLPIADRLKQTLNDLRKAFAREKQAAADISHELRTPLAALLTTVELALRKSRSPEDYRELLQDCQFSGQQMMHLVERLLALARLDAGAVRLHPTAVDVADLAQQCVNLVRPLADAKELSLNVHSESSVPVQADGGKLREIMNNLLHNAIQYNKPHGSIDLTVQHSNGQLRIQVSDTGIGIPPEARAHIFERFFRADPSRHSDSPHAGLGLAIVKSYIDLMNGRIDVDSNGAATTFTVEIPVGSVEWRVTSSESMAVSNA